ncbi:autism susceptibility gene 2 protein homolog isoform X1 [Haliotis rubra]|uniref:autism susceptibility gene 2 protein homolog isoform X1 n=1 Tax=Haliotis rubra TaxID=36100 RepID=UPI001EE59649|nr:autism susceptibility gene 2 protein homolog isoform X1 [Haliotis rubra]
METEPKPQRFQRNRRRERAYQLQQEKQGTQDASGDEGDESPPRTSKDKGRGKPRRRRNSSVEEDIIDGFAIVSFKSLEDLEESYKNTNGIRQPKPEKPNSRPPSPPKEKQKPIKKKYQKKNCSTAPSPTSDQPSPTVDHTRSPAPEDEEPQTNGPPRSISRDRLSDASTHSSSGQGYIPECESESEDDQVSESGSDLFTAVTVNHNRSSSERLAPTIPLTPPPPQQPTPPATTCNGTAVVTTTPSTTISVTTATTTTTTCSTPTTSPALTTTTICRPPSRPLVSPVLSRRPTPTPPPPPPRQSPLPPRQSPVPIPKQKLPPPPVVVSREPVKVTPPPVKTPRRDESAPHLHPHPHSHPHPHAPHPHQHQHQRDREREREKEQREREQREREREISSHHNLFPGSLPFSKPSLWPPSVSNHLYSGHHPLAHSPSLHSPSLHPLHPHGPSFPPHSVAQSPIQHTTPPHPSHSMFAPPIPPGPPPLTSTALTPVAAPANHFANEPIIRNQDFLHQDLNNRILAHNRETSQPIGPTPYIRSETTHHQHQHLHNHQHMHQHYNALGPPPSLVPTPPPHLFDKIPKAYDSLYRPSLMPSPYPGFSSLLPPGPTANHLTSGLHGAFQPKVRSMQPSTSSVLLPLRDRDKPLPPSTSLPQQKKSGKWCAVHVRVAWEIYHHQQKQQNDPTKGLEVKPGDPLRPPSHLMPGPALHPRPPELGGGNPGSLLGAHSRSLLEAHGSNSFLNPHIGVPSFPRPSPYPSSVGFGGLGSLGSLGGSPFGTGRDVTAIPGVTPPHEWNRLHRTPPSFPSWPKLDLDRESERERELEREREREREQREREREREQRERDRERELNERRREEERERERRNAESRERLNSFVDIERSRDRFKEHERRRSRSRSRSPMRNGRVDSAKSDTSSLERQSIKVKEERRDEEFINNINNMNAEREKLLRNNLVGLGHVPPTNPMVGFNMLERNRVLGPHYFPMDRPPHSQPLWNPFEKGLSMNPLDLDRERMAALRFTSPMAVIEQERLKEQIMREEMEMRSRYLDRIPSYDRFAFEQSKLPMRTPDPLGLPPFSRTISPAVNHSGHGHSHHNHNHNHNHNHTGQQDGIPCHHSRGSPASDTICLRNSFS